MQTSSKDTLGTELWRWIIQKHHFLTPHILSADTSECVWTILPTPESVPSAHSAYAVWAVYRNLRSSSCFKPGSGIFL